MMNAMNYATFDPLLAAATSCKELDFRTGSIARASGSKKLERSEDFFFRVVYLIVGPNFYNTTAVELRRHMSRETDGISYGFQPLSVTNSAYKV